MAESKNIERERWLVAAWPGMGNVALLAAGNLLEQLRAINVHELDPREFFEPRGINVKNGLATAARLPRSMFFEWTNPRNHQDLLIFIGEAQPITGGSRLCQRVIEYAASRGVKHLCTFAAMSTQLQLGTTPKVFAAATNPNLLDLVCRQGANVLEGGEIGGLNGLLLAAGTERQIAGACLLGELPFFATGVPNPRAAQIVLECFTSLLGIEIDLNPLKKQADLVDEKLIQLFEQLKNEPQQEPEPQEIAESREAGFPSPAIPQPQHKTQLDAKTVHRIESLFEKARQDRTQALELKSELDKLGVFKQYEDRFLDLFRNAT